MCDFRIIEKIVLEDGTIIDTSNYIRLPASEYKENFKPEEPNLYYFYATGSQYLYWDGKEWLHEFTKYNYDNDVRVGWKPVIWKFDESYLYEMGGATGFYSEKDDKSIMFPDLSPEEQDKKCKEWIKKQEEGKE